MSVDTHRSTRIARVAPRERRASRVVLAALTLFGLVSVAVVDAGGASAAPARKGASVPAHTKLELKMINALGRELNRERAAHKLKPVRYNRSLVVSARRHNLDMARHNEMSHQLPGEAYFADRMTAAGYRWSWAGENIAWNSDVSVGGVIELEKLMYAERPPNDGHRQNILSTHFRDVGVDVYIDKAHHKVWLTTDFGHH